MTETVGSALLTVDINERRFWRFLLQEKSSSITYVVSTVSLFPVSLFWGQWLCWWLEASIAKRGQKSGREALGKVAMSWVPQKGLPLGEGYTA